MRAAGTDKPVLAAFIAAEGMPACLLEADRLIATFEFPESAARALGQAAGRAEWLRRAVGDTPDLEGIDRQAAQALVAEVLPRRTTRG